VVKFTPREGTPVPMKYKARWAPEPIWGHFEEVKNF